MFKILKLLSYFMNAACQHLLHTYPVQNIAVCTKPARLLNLQLVFQNALAKSSFFFPNGILQLVNISVFVMHLKMYQSWLSWESELSIYTFTLDCRVL